MKFVFYQIHNNEKYSPKRHNYLINKDNTSIDCIYLGFFGIFIIAHRYRLVNGAIKIKKRRKASFLLYYFFSSFICKMNSMMNAELQEKRLCDFPVSFMES